MTLKCPHCGEPLGDKTCSACNLTLPEGSLYCCWCGQELASDHTAHEAQGFPAGHDEDEPIDFANRTLCSDGTCIGVIGPDGRCKECGKLYTGDPEEG